MSLTPHSILPERPDIDDLKKADLSKTAKYTEKYRLAREKEIEQAAQKMADEAAQKKRANRTKVLNFFLDVLKAALGGVIALAVEHIADIIAFVQSLFR